MSAHGDVPFGKELEGAGFSPVSCALCHSTNGGHDLDCPALGADAAAKPMTLEDAIARAHPADDPIVKLREIAQQLTYFQIRRGYELAKWLDNWLDRYTK